MATGLIESMSVAVAPEDYRDTYQRRVEKLIEDKRAGREVVTEAESVRADRHVRPDGRAAAQRRGSPLGAAGEEGDERRASEGQGARQGRARALRSTDRAKLECGEQGRTDAAGPEAGPARSVHDEPRSARGRPGRAEPSGLLARATRPALRAARPAAGTVDRTAYPAGPTGPASGQRWPGTVPRCRLPSSSSRSATRSAPRRCGWPGSPRSCCAATTSCWCAGRTPAPGRRSPASSTRARNRPPLAAVRETEEEAGVRATAESLVWVHVTPPVVYPNGDRSQYLDLVFRMRWTAGEPNPADGENMTPAGSRWTRCRRFPRRCSPGSGPRWTTTPRPLRDRLVPAPEVRAISPVIQVAHGKAPPELIPGVSARAQRRQASAGRRNYCANFRCRTR